MATSTQLLIPEDYRRLALFARLAADEADTVWRAGRMLHLPSDWSLVIEDQPPEEAYIILEGHVSVHRQGEPVAELGDGELVGEGGLLRDGPRTATATASGPLAALVLSRDDFHRLRDDIPSFRVAVDAVAHARRAAMSAPDTVVLDVDGTLVDSAFQHTVAWGRAFAAKGFDVPLWSVHRAVGLGARRLMEDVVGEVAAQEHGEEIQAAHDEAFESMIADIKPTPGAAELLARLRERGLTVVLTSSTDPRHTARLLESVGSGDGSDGDGELTDIEVAVTGALDDSAVVIGATIADIEVSDRSGTRSIGLRCGGFGESELRAAGAELVFDSPADLLEHLDDTPFGTA